MSTIRICGKRLEHRGNSGEDDLVVVDQGDANRLLCCHLDGLADAAPITSLEGVKDSYADDPDGCLQIPCSRPTRVESAMNAELTELVDTGSGSAWRSMLTISALLIAWVVVGACWLVTLAARPSRSAALGVGVVMILGTVCVLAINALAARSRVVRPLQSLARQIAHDRDGELRHKEAVEQSSVPSNCCPSSAATSACRSAGGEWRRHCEQRRGHLPLQPPAP